MVLVHVGAPALLLLARATAAKAAKITRGEVMGGGGGEADGGRFEEDGWSWCGE